MALEAAVAVAELADVALTRIEKRNEYANVMSTKDNYFSSLEHQLGRERQENKLLKEKVESYEKVFFELNQICADEPPNGKRYELYFKKLQARISSAEFRENFEILKKDSSMKNGSSIEKINREEEETVKLYSYSVWYGRMKKFILKNVKRGDDDDDDDDKNEKKEVNDEDFVILDEDDLIDSMATFLSKALLLHPEIKKMTPQEILNAVDYSFTELRSKSKLRKIWEWSKFAYGSGKCIFACFNVYKHPLVANAILYVLWVSSKRVFSFII